jgi:hypothetical protein
VHEVDNYLTGPSTWLVNYATANFLVNRRMNKSQQMRWSRRGADLLPQVRCAVCNGAFGSGFGHVFESISHHPLCGRPQVGNAFVRNFLRFFCSPQDTRSDAGGFVPSKSGMRLADLRIVLFDLGEAILPSRPQFDCAALSSGGQGWPPA